MVPPGAIQSSTLTDLHVHVPLGAVNGKDQRDDGGRHGAERDDLTVTQPPRATGFSPTAAPVGTTVTITGTNLTGATEVTFSGAVTRDADGGDGDIPKGGGAGGRGDGPGERHQRGRDNRRAQPTSGSSPKITGFTPRSVVGGSDGSST